MLETSVCAGSRKLAGEDSGEPAGSDESTTSGADRRAFVALAFVVGLVVLGAAMFGRRLRAS